MIFIQDLFSLREISDLFRLLFPGHADQPVDVRARDRAFSRHRRHGLEPVQLLHGLLFGLVSHAGFFNLLLQLFELCLLILATKLFVNGFDLLVEVVLLLGLLHLSLDASLNRAIELSFLNLCFQQLDQTLQARLSGKDLQQSLFVFNGDSQL